MVIIHIAAIDDILFSGVGVVVPQHVIHQQKKDSVGFINVHGLRIEGINNQFPYNKDALFNDLPSPFNRPEIVIIHELYYKEYLSIYRRLVRMKIPYIIVPHGGLTKHAQETKKVKKTIANHLLFNRIIKKAKAIHFLSEEEKKESFNLGKKGFVIPNGIDFEEQDRKHIVSNHTTFTYIGRIDIYHKGLDALIEAVQRLSKIRNNFSVNVYGPHSDDTERLRQMISGNKLDHIVSMHGGVTGASKLNVLNDSDYFIQTSRFEGMPMGILEALNMGVPCCVTDGTNVTGYVREYCAGYTSTNDVMEIARMMEKAIDEKIKYEDMCRNAQKLIKHNFAWDIIADRTLSTYRENCN